MKKKVAEYIAEFIQNQGITTVFTVTGGGAMHLNDALGHKEGLHCIYNHHEQACAIAAEGYARYSGRVAAVCVTSGPGGTNAITGVLGGWQDSIPMFIVSGQVKRETTTLCTGTAVRQLGDQEFQIVDCIKGMTKYAVMVTVPEEIRYHLEKAWYLCNHGRKGPVWLDIPLDVQGAFVETEELSGFNVNELEKVECPTYNEKLTEVILDKIYNAKRPVIYAGTGIRLGGAYEEFLKFIDYMRIPVVTAWNANDLLPDNHPYYCGRPGTVGTRGGNFVVQNSDLLLVLGSRLNIRLISYNYESFAKDAYKIIVDIDDKELHKPTIKADLPINADVKEVLGSLNRKLQDGKKCYKPNSYSKWLEFCKEVNQRYPVTLPEYYQSEKLNPYVFIKEFTQHLAEDDAIICGNGSACVMTFQAAEIKAGQRMFTNSGCAAMGYGFPAALGVCFARQGRRTICIDGDGSFQMNIQELQTLVYHHQNLKIVIINNNGYHSIRQTQTNLFHPPLVGVCADNGISFPNMEKIAYAYGIPYICIDRVEEINKNLMEVMEKPGPLLIEAVVDEKQNFAPKLSSRVLPDGTMESPELDDMFPFLDRTEYQKLKQECRENI